MQLRIRLGTYGERAMRRVRIMTEAALRKALAEAWVASGSLQSRRLRLIQPKKLSMV